MNEQRIAQLESLVADLSKTVAMLADGKYLFSDREEWKKTLKLLNLSLTNLSLSGTLDVTGATNLKGGISANGTPGVTTSFSLTSSATVTTKNGLITSVV